MPKKWRRTFRKDNFRIVYIDLTTNEIHLYTYIEEQAEAKLREKRAIYEDIKVIIKQSAF